MVQHLIIFFIADFGGSLIASNKLNPKQSPKVNINLMKIKLIVLNSCSLLSLKYCVKSVPGV